MASKVLSAEPSEPRTRQRLAVAGGLFGALAASACCIAPLVLFSLGVGGAWMSNLTGLAPYQPYILTFTVGSLGYGYWLVYRARRRRCAEDQMCARPLPERLMLTGLILATALVIAAVAFNLLAPLLLKP